MMPPKFMFIVYRESFIESEVGSPGMNLQSKFFEYV